MFREIKWKFYFVLVFALLIDTYISFFKVGIPVIMVIDLLITLPFAYLAFSYIFLSDNRYADIAKFYLYIAVSWDLLLNYYLIPEYDLYAMIMPNQKNESNIFLSIFNSVFIFPMYLALYRYGQGESLSDPLEDESLT